MNFWHILQIIIFLQCTDYFWHPFGIIFFVQSELFLVTLHELFLATVNLISGSVMHCVTLTCMSINGHTGLSSSRHYENMELSVGTRIAQIARNAIQEIDRIAQIVRTNEPSFSSARAERSSSSTSNETRSSSTNAGGSTSSDPSTGQSRPVLPSLSRVCGVRDRKSL